ncbi:UNVERIFIED_CONTAM: hypothetical protein PYX00_010444 [Menopon gallinae]|uniref:Uncharacterized protein n=1 Tax=Menopon gallinae TaxID=328185 RepID=A0AAW2HGA3_9NEOP
MFSTVFKQRYPFVRLICDGFAKTCDSNATCNIPHAGNSNSLRHYCNFAVNRMQPCRRLENLPTGEKNGRHCKTFHTNQVLYSMDDRQMREKLEARILIGISIAMLAFTIAAHFIYYINYDIPSKKPQSQYDNQIG